MTLVSIKMALNAEDSGKIKAELKPQIPISRIAKLKIV